MSAEAERLAKKARKKERKAARLAEAQQQLEESGGVAEQKEKKQKRKRANVRPDLLDYTPARSPLLVLFGDLNEGELTYRLRCITVRRRHPKPPCTISNASRPSREAQEESDRCSARRCASRGARCSRSEPQEEEAEAEGRQGGVSALIYLSTASY